MFQTKVVCYTAVREERPSDGRLVHRQIRYNTVRSNNIFLQCDGVESSLWLRTRLDATISRAPVNVQASIKDGTVCSHHCVFAQARKKRLKNASCGRGVLFENGGKCSFSSKRPQEDVFTDKNKAMATLSTHTF